MRVLRNYPDGTPYIEVFVDHISGVDFRFHSVEVGYEQTTAEMEMYLVGFKQDLGASAWAN